MSDSKQIIGASLPRRDALRLAVGRGAFTDDIVLPRMLHMALVRSPYAHALIKSIDITDAKNAGMKEPIHSAYSNPKLQSPMYSANVA